LQSVSTLCSIIRDPDHKLESIDLTGNLITEDQIELLKISISTNKSLVLLDLRKNPGYKQGMYMSIRILVCLNVT
jgi:hypothetical protein